MNNYEEIEKLAKKFLTQKTLERKNIKKEICIPTNFNDLFNIFEPYNYISIKNYTDFFRNLEKEYGKDAKLTFDFSSIDYDGIQIFLKNERIESDEEYYDRLNKHIKIYLRRVEQREKLKKRNETEEYKLYLSLKEKYEKSKKK